MNQPPNFSDSTEALKVPPNSIEAEQSVLGGLMLDNEAWDGIADMVTDSDFYRRDHRLIFRTVSTMMEQGLSCDAITIAERLDGNGLLDEAGGVSYLGELVSAIPSVANIKAYAEIVRERAVSRNLIKIANEIADSAFLPEGQTVEALLDNAEKKVFELAEHGTRHRAGFEPLKKLLVKAVERIETVYASDDVITGVSTGMDRFDEETSGLQNSDLIIIAGRPSMGKTSFAMNIAENSAVKSQCPVAVFSLEMPGDQLAMRLISSFGRINLKDLRTGNLNDDDWPRITSALGILSEAPIYVDYTPGLTPTELRAKARRLKRENGLGMIIIDYLQLMESGAGGQGDNRANELSTISRSLKSLAMELQVPVIALSQLNRALEQRPNKRPVMSDLRESGAIEQDADLIVFIYRDEVYYKEESQDKGIAEIIIAKQRNGPIGSVRMAFLNQFTRFENLAPEMYGEQEYE